MRTLARLAILIIFGALASSCGGGGGSDSSSAPTGSTPPPTTPPPTTPPPTTPPPTTPPPTTPPPTTPPPGNTSGPAFPLSISQNRRYLVDSQGTAFLIQGDTAWSLIADLSREDVDRYLQDRADRGFNTIIVNLIEHQFARNAPRNFYGDAPFTTAGDFSTPNEAYFAHADYVLQKAHDLGFAVLLVPAYLGFGGGSQGWYQELTANTAAKLQGYGHYLGQRYHSFDNIIWTLGGDYNPPNKTVVQRIIAGIREVDTSTLATAHCNAETAAVDYWGSESWLTLNNVYTYNAVYTAALTQYQRSGPMPFFLIESAYENEQSATTLRLRTQAYHAVLSGAAGQLFGNNPIWHFAGPGVFSAPSSWQQQLNSPGAQSMTRLKTLLDGVSWWTLEPDTQARLLTSGARTGQDHAVAAVSPDGATALVYVPSIRDIGLDFSTLAGPHVTATWYDPTGSTSTTATGSPFTKDSAPTLRAPSNNLEGTGDWLLVLRSVP